MKTIKPFKMLCETVEQRDEVLNVLIDNKIKQCYQSKSDDCLTIKLYKDMTFSILATTPFKDCIGEEITYQQFKQLYS
jgi:hypothetical protein